MYLGRIIAVGKNKNGKLVAMYRVSSRSFPNREIIVKNNIASVVLKKGYEQEINTNAYISYNCLINSEKFVVVSNGTHSDFIQQKLNNNCTVKDSLVQVLLAMDYEYDQLNTPRIAAVIDKQKDNIALAIVRKDGLEFKYLNLNKQELVYISTYTNNTVYNHKITDFDVSNDKEACNYILNNSIFASNPISSASAFETDDNYLISSKNI